MSSDDLISPAWLAAQPSDVLTAAAQWLTTPALSALSGALGGPAIQEVPEDLAALAQWSRRVLDARGGAERHEAPARSLPENAIRLLLNAGHDLGLLATHAPALSAYDLTIILGGTTTGNRLRVALASEAAQHGTNLGVIAGLAAHRLLGTTERIAEQIPQAESTEWQNLLREISVAFCLDMAGPPEPEEAPGDFLTALDKKVNNPAGREIRILVAPSRDPKRRADTRDAVDYLINRIPIARRRRVLIITSAIYAPYQFFVVAPRLLTTGTQHAELVGTPTQTTGDKALLAQRIAQEIHSAIHATYHLCTTAR